MIVHYGFNDASGDWFLILDTDRCNGCGKCAEVCPSKILEVGPDEMDIFREGPVASVQHHDRKKVKYSCAPCKPGHGATLPPCIAVCRPGAISFSDGWVRSYNRK